MVINMRHTGIVVENMDESMRFYAGLLGFIVQKQMFETGGYISKVLNSQDAKVKTVKMSTPDGQLIELLEFVLQKQQLGHREIHDVGISHVAFTIEHLEEEYQRLKGAGVFFLSSPQVSPDGYAKVAFCRAPEGTYIELVELLQR